MNAAQILEHLKSLSEKVKAAPPKPKPYLGDGDLLIEVPVASYLAPERFVVHVSSYLPTERLNEETGKYEPISDDVIYQSGNNFYVRTKETQRKIAESMMKVEGVSIAWVHDPAKQQQDEVKPQ